MNIPGSFKKEQKREVWKIWEEGGCKPNMVVELLSKTTKSFDLNKKKDIYEQILQTEDYFVFDPHLGIGNKTLI